MKEIVMQGNVACFALSLVLPLWGCSSNTSSDLPRTGQPEQGATAGNGQGTLVDSIPKPKQVGPTGKPGYLGDGSDEEGGRPGQVFIDGWLASHIVTGRFTGISTFSESTWGLWAKPDAYSVGGFTDYVFAPDLEIALAFPGLAVTRCSLTDEAIMGASDARTLSVVSIAWGTTQIIDGSGETHPVAGAQVEWNEPAPPAGSSGDVQVLLLLDAAPYPHLGHSGSQRAIRYILRAAFEVVGGVVKQEDGTTLTLAEIAATAEARMTKARQEYDAKLACTKHPEKHPTWPGYSDPSCRRTDCGVPTDEVENP